MAKFEIGKPSGLNPWLTEFWRGPIQVSSPEPPPLDDLIHDFPDELQDMVFMIVESLDAYTHFGEGDMHRLGDALGGGLNDRAGRDVVMFLVQAAQAARHSLVFQNRERH